MNLTDFENKETSHHDGESSHHASFAHNEAHLLKQKIEKRKAKQKKLRYFIIGTAALVIFLVSLVAYSQYRLYVLTQDEVVGVPTMPASITGASSTSTPKTGEEILVALRKHILLPPGNPQIAEIQDVEKLRETQAFFKNAANGDVVVVYETTIFIYRPSRDIVVASGDISGVGEKNP